MAVLVFTVIFVALGLGVLFVGLSGGPKGARSRMSGQSRRGRALGLAGFALGVLVLGVVIPAAVVRAVENRNEIPSANVRDLTAQDKEGREIFGQRCANCHTLKAVNAVAEVGPSLDKLRPPKNLVLDAINKGRARGNGQMAAQLVEGEQAEAVAGFVAKAVGQSEEK